MADIKKKIFTDKSGKSSGYNKVDILSNARSFNTGSASSRLTNEQMGNKPYEPVIKKVDRTVKSLPPFQAPPMLRQTFPAPSIETPSFRTPMLNISRMNEISKISKDAEEAERKYQAELEANKQQYESSRSTGKKVADFLKDVLVPKPVQNFTRDYAISSLPDVQRFGAAPGDPTIRQEQIDFYKQQGIDARPSKAASFLGNVAPFMPGAGLGSVAGAAEGALLTKLGGGVASKLGQLGAAPVLQRAGSAAVKGAGIGAAENVGVGLAQGQDTLDDIAQNAALGAAGGAVIGGALPVVGAGLHKGVTTIADKYAGTKVGDALQRFIGERTPTTPNEPVQQPLLALPPGRGETRLQQAQQRANLPYGADAIEASGRISPIPINQPLALPESKYKRTILKPVSNEKMLDRVMNEIKPIVDERIGTRRATNNEATFNRQVEDFDSGIKDLHKERSDYVKQMQDAFAESEDSGVFRMLQRFKPRLPQKEHAFYTEIRESLNFGNRSKYFSSPKDVNKPSFDEFADMIGMSTAELLDYLRAGRQQFDESMLRNDPVMQQFDEAINYLTNSKQQHIDEYNAIPAADEIYQEAIKVAQEKGYNLQDLLEGNAPNISQKLREDAQKRIYGIYPTEAVPVRKPDTFARTAPGEALLSQQLRSNRVSTPLENAKETIQRAESEVAPASALARTAELPRSVAQPKVRGERGFTQTLERSGKLTPEVAEQLKVSPNRTYEPITNVDTLNKANERISKNIDDAEYFFMNAKKPTADSITTGMRLIGEYQKSGDVTRATRIADEVARQLTEAGQAIQSSSMWDRLTPEGALLVGQQIAKRSGKELDAMDADAITNIANVAQKAGASVKRTRRIQEIAKKVNSKENVSMDEVAELTNFIEDAKSYFKPAKPKASAKPPKLPSDKKVRERILNSLNDKEAQLMEFINKNKRRVSSTPLDLWGAYAALGAIKIAKGAISFSRWSEEMLKIAGDEIRPHLVNLFDRSANEAEQLERLLPDKTAAEKVAQKYIDAEKLTSKDATFIHDLATKIGQMNTKDKQLASRQMQEVLSKYEKSSIVDKINAYRYIAMLGNTSTQLTNMISSPLNYLESSMLNMIQTPIDVLRAGITGKPRQVTFKQGASVWDNFFKPASDWWEGLKVGGEAGWKGIDPNGITSQNDVKGLAFKSKFNPLHWAEKSLGAVMKGADFATYNAAVQKKYRQLAYLDALNKGIKGDDNIRQYMDRYLNNIDDNIAELADKYGKELTFQQETPITKGAQSVVRGLNKLTTFGKSDKIGIGSALVPFVRTPTNILMSGLERTPAGLLKGIHELATMSKNPDITPAQIMNTFTKAIVGTTGLTGTGYLLGKLGVITGDSSSSDKDVQALEQDIGKGKFKFNTTAFSRVMDALISGNVKDIEQAAKYQEGDKQLNYNRLQPFAFPVAMGATFAEQQRQAQAAEERGGEIPLSTQLGESVSSAGQSLFDMSLLKGLQDAFDVNPGEGIADILTGVGQSFVKSFSPSLLAQETRRQDEAQRLVTNKGLTEPVKEYFQSRIPGQSQQLPPKVTTMGDTKMNEPGVIANYLNPLQLITPKYNKASQVIYDLIQQTGDDGLAPKPLEKTVRGKDTSGKSTTVSIPAKRYAEAQQRVGKEITDAIIKLPTGLPPEELAKRIEKIYKEARENERIKLKNEFKLH